MRQFSFNFKQKTQHHVTLAHETLLAMPLQAGFKCNCTCVFGQFQPFHVNLEVFIQYSHCCYKACNKTMFRSVNQILKCPVRLHPSIYNAVSCTVHIYVLLHDSNRICCLAEKIAIKLKDTLKIKLNTNKNQSSVGREDWMTGALCAMGRNGRKQRHWALAYSVVKENLIPKFSVVIC